MHNTLGFIRYKALNRHVLGGAWRWDILKKWIDGGKVEHLYIGHNPKNKTASYPSLTVNPRTGRWHDNHAGDAGEDMISLCAYLFGLSYHKAALRIIEEMRLSHA